SHPLVVENRLQPDTLSPRMLALALDADQYPASVESVRIDLRWYESGDYTVHYIESRAEGEWQCRWDRHPKPDAPQRHCHPPPDASADVEATPLDAEYHIGVLFEVLDWVGERVASLHDE
ncbi:MAG: hypothetical protein ABEI99_07235, partial [Halobaculum sp.]